MGLDYSDGTRDRTGLFDGRESGADFNVAALLDRSQAVQTEWLEWELRGVTAQLAQRDAVHESIVDDLTWKRDRYLEKLRTLYSRGTGRNGTRAQVKDRIAEFEAALRDEYRAHWRDRQTLEEERRAITRELAELEDVVWSELLDGY